MIVGNAGILVSRVVYTKQSGEKRFLIQDAAMNDLIRPALYESFHRIWPVVVPAGLPPAPDDAETAVAGTEPWDVVGPVCESGDFLAKDRPLPRLTVVPCSPSSPPAPTAWSWPPTTTPVPAPPRSSSMAPTPAWSAAAKPTRISSGRKWGCNHR